VRGKTSHLHDAASEVVMGKLRMLRNIKRSINYRSLSPGCIVVKDAEGCDSLGILPVMRPQPSACPRQQLKHHPSLAYPTAYSKSTAGLPNVHNNGAPAPAVSPESIVRPPRVRSTCGRAFAIWHNRGSRPGQRRRALRRPGSRKTGTESVRLFEF
jgi:hypothetical protein